MTLWHTHSIFVVQIAQVLLTAATMVHVLGMAHASAMLVILCPHVPPAIHFTLDIRIVNVCIP
jgi:hypothetical protein